MDSIRRWAIITAIAKKDMQVELSRTGGTISFVKGNTYAAILKERKFV